MKHFRQQGYENAFDALQQQTQVHLEHPAMSELHSTLVLNGKFGKTEDIVEKFVTSSLNKVFFFLYKSESIKILVNFRRAYGQPFNKTGI